MKIMFIFLFIIHHVSAAAFQIQPGAVFEDVGDTKFIQSYLDLWLDLACSHTVFNQLLYVNNSLNSIHSFINNTLHTKHLSYNTSNALMTVYEIENINIMA